jgi:hypothetical protein
MTTYSGAAGTYTPYLNGRSLFTYTTYGGYVGRCRDFYFSRWIYDG